MEQQKPIQAVNSDNTVAHKNEKKFPQTEMCPTKDTLNSLGEQLASELVQAKLKILEETIARQQAEQALRESENRFQTFVEAIPQQVWTAEPDGTLDYVNDRVLKYFNRAFDEMIGWGWKGVIHQDDLPMCVKCWADARRTGKPYEMEFRLRRGSDGAYLWHVGRALPVHDDRGRIIKWFGTNTDISACKVIEENLVRLNQQKKLILESVGEGIYGLDLEGRTTFVNPAAAKMIGWNPQDFLGQSQHAVLHHTRSDGTAYPPEECPIHAAFKDGEVHHVDHEVFWRKDGTSFPVEYVSTPLWEEEKLKGAVVTFLDITERRRSKALLEGEKEVLEMITKGADLTRILDRICYMVEDHSNGMMCSILIREGKRLRHGAAPSLPDSYNQKIDGTTIGPNAGSCGTAAFRKEPVFVSDIAKDPLWERGKDLALSHGLKACWSTPFYASTGSVLGTFALYYTQTRSSDRVSQDLVKLWANLAGIAVERRQSENLLRASEEKFRTVTQSANDAIISADAQGLVTSWNPAAQVMFAYEEREILGRPLADLMPERYRDAHKMGLERLKKPGAKRQLTRTVELHGLRKNGSEFPLELSLSGWEMNGASFFTGIIRDITERKQAEESIQKAYDQLEDRVQQRTTELEKTNHQLLQEIADRRQAREQLRKSEDHLQALIAALPELIILYRKDGTIIDIRAGSEVMTQLIPEDCRGKKIDQVFPVDLANSMIYCIQKALETKRKQFSKYETCRNGKTEYYEVRYIVKSETEVLSVVQNISERKRMEVQIREYTNNLEELVEKRTMEVKQLEVQQAENEKLAALGQLAAGVAHEINNPLGGVINGFFLIKDSIPQDSRVSKYVEIVDRGIDRITKIIGQMYQLYGSGVKNLKLVNVGMVVKDVLQLLEKQLNQRDLKAVIEVQADLPDMYLSELGLDQVLTNLIQNAIDASPRGSQVKIQAKTEEDCLHLNVTDSGSGISPELRSRIFEPFFTTKEGHQKSNIGLGLSVSNSVIEAMGGRIEVDTQFGEGSTFRVVIPMNTSVSKIKGHADL